MSENIFGQCATLIGRAAIQKNLLVVPTPTEDMHIATKKYVDSKELISSSTEGSTKKFKITVDDSGTLKATEVTE